MRGKPPSRVNRILIRLQESVNDSSGGGGNSSDQLTLVALGFQRIIPEMPEKQQGVMAAGPETPPVSAHKSEADYLGSHCKGPHP